MTWEDDNHEWHVNRGYRVQYNAALGPLSRAASAFDPSVNLSIIKFLGFEQVFKDAMTGLPIGGAKGGSDFDPRGKSDAEVMAFSARPSSPSCIATSARTSTAPPATWAAAAVRSATCMASIAASWALPSSALCPVKAVSTGGSILRPEATGYGAVYYLVEALAHDGESIEGKRIAMSGYGNVGGAS